MLTRAQKLKHAELGVPDDYENQGLQYYADAEDLVEVGPNIVGRVQRLTPLAAIRWSEMVAAANTEGVELLMVSGFRSFDYQAGLLQRKLLAGQIITDILKVNTAPGYSEHHSGNAIDIAAPGSPPLIEQFETLDAFEWLSRSASQFGFRMSYPRANPFGLAYEPWHWALRE